MNNRPIEERLAAPDPTTRGYRPRPLPRDLASARASLAQLDRRRLLVSLVGLVGGVTAATAAAAVVFALVAAPRSSTVGTGSPSASPTAAETPVSPRACRSADLTAMAERWTGAAGSRGTVVTVVNDSNRICSLAGQPTAAILDSHGRPVGAPPTVLVTSSAGSTPTRGGQISLLPGHAATTTVVWSNWCGATPVGRLVLELRIAGDAASLPVRLVAGDAIPVPPCLGAPGSTSQLTASPFVRANPDSGSAVPTQTGAPVASPTVTPVPTATPTAVSACGPGQVTAAADRWQGAAGSRGTTVTVVNQSPSPCTVQGYPFAFIYDAGGRLLIDGGAPSPPSAYRPVTLGPGQGTTFNVIWSNWCGRTPAEPLSLRMRLSDGSTIFAVRPLPGDSIPVPPCLGSPGSPSTLSTSPVGGG
ncbi:MAG: hypothetical protein DLM71_07170 [Chloroflexi bacterium]|nr:MAG: hypothetical protein DLM71_07170 [Chloroflexota bacterium]